MKNIDAAEGHWLSNRNWIIIIIAIIGFTAALMGCYYSLRAADAEMIAQHNTFKEIINTKLDNILEKIDDGRCDRD